MHQDDLLAAVRQGTAAFTFAEVLACIDAAYHFTPTAFRNGNQNNPAGSNPGSCRVFAFAQKHHLTASQTLQLFAEHYREVQENPHGESHNNIRQFMQHGWEKIQFFGEPLHPRSGVSDA